MLVASEYVSPFLIKYFFTSLSKLSYSTVPFFKSAIKSNASWLAHTSNVTLYVTPLSSNPEPKSQTTSPSSLSSASGASSHSTSSL